MRESQTVGPPGVMCRRAPGAGASVGGHRWPANLRKSADACVAPASAAWPEGDAGGPRRHAPAEPPPSVPVEGTRPAEGPERTRASSPTTRPSARAFNTFTGHVLFASTLSPRQRELLILRVAAVREAAYEWRQHVVLASDAGITPEEVARIAEGPEAPGGRRSTGPWSARSTNCSTTPWWPTDTWEVLAAVLEVEQLHGPRLHRRGLRHPGHGLPVASASRSTTTCASENGLLFSRDRWYRDATGPTGGTPTWRTSRSQLRGAGRSTTPSWARARSTTRTRSRPSSTSSSARPSSAGPGSTSAGWSRSPVPAATSPRSSSARGPR